MTRAEERGLEALPPRWRKTKDGKGKVDSALPVRKFWIRAYEQAEKDLKEWIEQQLAILDKQTLLHPDDDVFWEQRNAYKQMKDKLNSL